MSSLRISLPGLEAFTDPERPLAGRYVVQREIGSGGMAFVLLATDLRHNRPVAIKILRGELATTVNADRFVREIEIAAGLTHPHVLPVHDSGAVDGILFYVMPFVEGETLAARIAREHSLSIQETVRLTREIASALDYAHQRGIVHRDIKPENVLLPGGVAVVADFGLARALEAESGKLRLTDVGVGVGTPTYLSPEQALGRNDVDARSDQYSLACVVFEMLTGRPPFDGKSVQAMLAQHISSPPPRASELKRELPRQIDAVLQRALSKSPDQRYGSVREFIGAFEAAATGSLPSRSLALPRLVPWTAAAVVAFVALGLFASRLPHRFAERATLDDNVIVVAPFDVLGNGLEFWREGLMDVLARSLDGAGPLRTVPNSVVLQSWSGRADRASVVALGRRERAGLAVFGQVIGTGADSLRVSLSLYDVRGDSALTGDFQIIDVSSRIDRVGDSASVRLLRALSRSRRISAAPTVSIGAHNLPALKAFLRGEQLYRHNDFANARSAYEEAIASDSNFALAYYRMANTVRWLGVNLAGQLPYAHRGGSLNHGLAPRDSLMILADSLLSDLRATDFIELDALARARRRVATLEHAAATYKGDAEVWTELAEARLRGAEGPEPRTVLVAIDSALRADSSFGPAYRTGIGLTLPLKGRDPALALARRYLKINPGDAMMSALAEVLSGHLSDAELRHASDTWPADAARNAAFVMAKWPDSSAAGVRWLRILTEKPGAPASFLGAALRFRGRIAEASQVLDTSFRYSPLGASELLFASRFSGAEAAKLDSLTAMWMSQGHIESAPIAVVRAHDRGDSAALVRFAQGIAIGGQQPSAQQRQYVSAAARAYLALMRRDSVSAEREFQGLPDTLAWEQNTAAIVLDAANVLLARNQGRAALTLLDRHSPSKSGVSGWQPVWYMTVARASARTGDRGRTESAAAYASAAWSRADAQPRVVLDSAISDIRHHGMLVSSASP